MSSAPHSSIDEILQLANEALKLTKDFSVTVRAEEGEMTIEPKGQMVVFNFGSAGSHTLSAEEAEQGLREQLEQIVTCTSYSPTMGELSKLTVGERAANLLVRVIDKAASATPTATEDSPAEEQAAEAAPLTVEDSGDASVEEAVASETETEAEAEPESAEETEAQEEFVESEPSAALSPQQADALASASVGQVEESDLFEPGFRGTLSDGTPVVLGQHKKGDGYSLKWESEAKLSDAQRSYLASFDVEQAERVMKEDLFDDNSRVWDCNGIPITCKTDRAVRGQPTRWFKDSCPRGIKIQSSRSRTKR